MVFSILVPVYNAERYIEDCLTSIVRQSYSDFECIIIDDGSTDSSKEIICKCIENEHRFKLISRENKGVSDTRNELISAASGEYIVWIDADDYVDVNLLLNVKKTLDTQNVDGVIFAYEVLNDGILRKEFLFDSNKILEKFYALECLAKEYKMPSFLWNKVFKKEAYNEVVFSKAIKMLEDYFIIPKLFLRCGSIAYINKCLYVYRQVDSSITHDINVDVLISNDYVIQQREELLLATCRSMLNAIRVGKAYRSSVYLELYSSFTSKNVKDKWKSDLKKNFMYLLFDNRISIKRKFVSILIAFCEGRYVFFKRIIKKVLLR